MEALAAQREADVSRLSAQLREAARQGEALAEAARARVAVQEREVAALKQQLEVRRGRGVLRGCAAGAAVWGCNRGACRRRPAAEV